MKEMSEGEETEEVAVKVVGSNFQVVLDASIRKEFEIKKGDKLVFYRKGKMMLVKVIHKSKTS